MEQRYPPASFCANHLHFVERRPPANRKPRGSSWTPAAAAGLFLQMASPNEAQWSIPVPVTGLDFSIDAAARCLVARPGFPAGLRIAFPQAPFAKRQLRGYPPCFNVLEHLYDPGEYLRAAHDLLAPKRAFSGPGAQRGPAGSFCCWANAGVASTSPPASD